MKRKIEELLELSILNLLNEEEKAELDVWRRANPAHEALYQELHDPAYLRRNYQQRRTIDVNRPLQDMERRIGTAQATSPKKETPKWSRWAAAACVLLVAGIGLSLWHREAPAELAQELAVTSLADIHPGETMAVLTTADSLQITLDNPNDVKVLAQTAAKKSTDPAKTATAQAELRYNCLDIPRGGEFHIELEDGTEVWLNSESQLHYPETFGETERRVKVEGEAYFKVAHDSAKPFFVETAGQQVQVYGTEFNVRDYPEDKYVSTVLVEGSIALSRLENPDNSLMLTPGRQVLFDKETEEAQVAAVNVKVITSWRDGQFVFENQTLLHIMNDLARWYNFDFEFADPALAEMLFMGSMQRSADFVEVLTILEKSGGLKFSLVDNKVRVERS